MGENESCERKGEKRGGRKTKAVLFPFFRWLQTATQGRRLVLIIDGLDQLEDVDAAHNLGMLLFCFASFFLKKKIACFGLGGKGAEPKKTKYLKVH